MQGSSEAVRRTRRPIGGPDRTFRGDAQPAQVMRKRLFPMDFGRRSRRPSTPPRRARPGPGFESLEARALLAAGPAFAAPADARSLILSSEIAEIARNHPAETAAVSQWLGNHAGQSLAPQAAPGTPDAVPTIRLGSATAPFTAGSAGPYAAQVSAGFPSSGLLDALATAAAGWAGSSMASALPPPVTGASGRPTSRESRARRPPPISRRRDHRTCPGIRA